MTELCGEPTAGGKLCNMPKGHHAPFHRYREYSKPMIWAIKDNEGKVIKKGNGRIQLGYAITEFARNGTKMFIEVVPGTADRGGRT